MEIAPAASVMEITSAGWILSDRLRNDAFFLGSDILADLNISGVF